MYRLKFTMDYHVHRYVCVNMRKDTRVHRYVCVNIHKDTRVHICRYLKDHILPQIDLLDCHGSTIYVNISHTHLKDHYICIRTHAYT